MQNTNTMQGIATSSVQGLVQQPQQRIGNLQPQLQNAVYMQQQQQQESNMQGIIQGGMGNAQGTVQNMGTGILQNGMPQVQQVGVGQFQPQKTVNSPVPQMAQTLVPQHVKHQGQQIVQPIATTPVQQPTVQQPLQ